MANQHYPQGYWSAVFEQAVSLLNVGTADSAEAAYWQARKNVDRALPTRLEAGLQRRRSQEQLALV